MKNIASNLRIKDMQNVSQEINTFCSENNYKLLNYTIQMFTFFPENSSKISKINQMPNPVTIIEAFLVVEVQE